MHSTNNQASSSVFTEAMTRRSAVRTIAGAGAALFAVTAAGRAVTAQESTERHTSQPYTVTANLNLRAQPNTNAKVLLVIPKGAQVAFNGSSQNGFSSVTYKGTRGWGYATYIKQGGSSGGGDPVIVGEAKTKANVNLRSGPGTNYQALRVVKSGSFVLFSNTVKNGFRYVTHQGLAGWISDQYLYLPGHGPEPGPVYDPNYATATANLNLRAEPSLSAKVLLVIPSGAKVRMEGGGSGQFAKVSYKGTVGWAATAYLN